MAAGEPEVSKRIEALIDSVLREGQSQDPTKLGSSPTGEESSSPVENKPLLDRITSFPNPNTSIILLIGAILLKGLSYLFGFDGMTTDMIEIAAVLPPGLGRLFDSGGLDIISRDYWTTLYRRFIDRREGLEEETDLIIRAGDRGNFHPSSFLKPEERVEFLGAKDYEKIVDEMRDERIDNYELRMASLDAGLGETLKRESYVRRLGRPHIGAKGPDLSFEGLVKELPDLEVSVAEVKLLRLIHEVEIDRSRRKVVFQPIVSDDSRPSYETLLEQPYLVDLINGKSKTMARSYKQVFDGLGIEVEMRETSYYPSLKADTLEPTYDRNASGSHGEWGFKYLVEALEHEPTNQPVMVSFYNGDGTNNMPDRYIVEWMIKHNVPLVMISTTKTGIDKKGGQIGIEFIGDDTNGEDRKVRIRMMELGTAKSHGQEQLFMGVGLKGGMGYAGEQYFNTNVSVINYSLISKILQDLLHEAFDDDEEEFYNILMPDLIASKKPKDNPKYFQLEGPIGTVFLNLHNFVQNSDDPKVQEILARHGVEKMLRIVNVPTEDRTKFFTPIKTASDFWLQAYTDFYWMNKDTWMLEQTVIDVVPPALEFEDEYYADVMSIIAALGHAKVKDLDSLTITGKPVMLADARLSGDVTIHNMTGEMMDLNKEDNLGEGIIAVFERGVIAFDRNRNLIINKRNHQDH